MHLAAAAAIGAVSVAAAARGRDGGGADALVVLGRVLPDQLVGVSLWVQMEDRVGCWVRVNFDYSAH